MNVVFRKTVHRVKKAYLWATQIQKLKRKRKQKSKEKNVWFNLSFANLMRLSTVGSFFKNYIKTYLCTWKSFPAVIFMYQ